MAGSTFGKHFAITTWGESHGKALGVVIDGCPAGLSLCEEDIQPMLDRRKPGQDSLSTPRKESDLVEILSGTFEGKTTGTPISLIIRNEDHRTKDYSDIAAVYRPGHADYTYDQKYGFRDYRGGGRSSGRETAARVAAGAVAKKILNEMGIEFNTIITEIGCKETQKGQMTEEIQKWLEMTARKGDSAGGIIECTITGVPAGIGEPIFDKLDSRLAAAIMSIGSVKGVEIGDGFQSAKTIGSCNNDSFAIRTAPSGQPNVYTTTNHAGGVLGGISNGQPIIIKAAIKPTPSIHQEQKTINQAGEEVTIRIGGRHDPIIALRAIVVVEAMAAITLIDLLIENMSAQIDNLRQFYGKEQ